MAEAPPPPPVAGDATQERSGRRVDPRAGLRADCSRCAGLCCVATGFRRSSDFAVDKPAGTPCLHLADDLRCSIHDRLRPSGFGGCTAYDCFGAGQRVVQETCAGEDWRDSPDTATVVFAVFAVMRDLHELMWHLVEAVAITESGPLLDRLSDALAEVRDLTGQQPEVLRDPSAPSVRDRLLPLLREAGERARSGQPGAGRAWGPDLSGRDLRRAELRGADLRGVLLLGVDLRATDLSRADLAGADLRGADLGGARLDSALFLTQMQLGAAHGDDATSLPDHLDRPPHWTAALEPR